MKNILKYILLHLVLINSYALANQKPNMIVILADDLGYGDVGFNGSEEILTPNIDLLAENGIICENGYVTHPYCGPSRAGLITGRYQSRFGMEVNCTYSPFDSNMGLPLSERTFAVSMPRPLFCISPLFTFE